jgi:hypothetical protein
MKIEIELNDGQQFCVERLARELQSTPTEVVAAMIRYEVAMDCMDREEPGWRVSRLALEVEVPDGKT